ncbi:Protein FAR-RED IMPAIRED RESPONSE 1 [Fusarium oxysporum f. sp. albedinis]|nr:Protein FAR-RED IMPAIRED RESPONSE 1 [Fusarium oxysporum f. sp. albedinis]
MYTAPIQEALQMVRSRISRAAIVDSLAQHVLKKHFGTARARRRNGWTRTLCAGNVTSRKRSGELRIWSTKGTNRANTQIW